MGLIHVPIISSMALKEISATFPPDIRALLDSLGGDIVAYREQQVGDERSGKLYVELTVHTHRLPPSPRPRAIKELRITAYGVVEIDLRFSRREAQ